MLAQLLALSAAAVDDADLLELQRMELRMGEMESELTRFEEDNERMRRLLERRDEGRRKLSETPSCCRATPSNACGASTTRTCSSLHDFLERSYAALELDPRTGSKISLLSG